MNSLFTIARIRLATVGVAAAAVNGMWTAKVRPSLNFTNFATLSALFMEARVEFVVF